MKSFTVERATWCRGNSAYSRLLTEGNTRCCLGHIGQQCDIDDSYLLNQTSPQTVNASQHLKFPEELLNGICNTDLTTQAIIINDNIEIDDTAREEALISLFEDEDIELTFV